MNLPEPGRNVVSMRTYLLAILLALAAPLAAHAQSADLAVQQISELKQVRGIEVIGPIPHGLQTPAVFSAGRMVDAQQAEAADKLLRYLASPEVVPVLRQSGLEP